MSATQDAKNWFVLLKGKRYGPYTFAALAHAAEKGVVDPEAGVWCLGWAEWRIARNVPGLFKPGPDDLEEDADEAEEYADDREDADDAEADDRDEEHREDEDDRDETGDRHETEDRDETDDRAKKGDLGKLAAARLTPDVFTAGKPLVALGRLSEPIADPRSRDADETAGDIQASLPFDLPTQRRTTQ